MKRLENDEGKLESRVVKKVCEKKGGGVSKGK